MKHGLPRGEKRHLRCGRLKPRGMLLSRERRAQCGVIPPARPARSRLQHVSRKPVQLLKDGGPQGLHRAL